MCTFFSFVALWGSNVEYWLDKRTIESSLQPLAPSDVFHLFCRIRHWTSPSPWTNSRRYEKANSYDGGSTVFRLLLFSLLIPPVICPIRGCRCWAPSCNRVVTLPCWALASHRPAAAKITAHKSSFLLLFTANSFIFSFPNHLPRGYSSTPSTMFTKHERNAYKKKFYSF